MKRPPLVVAALSLFLVTALATPAFAWQFGLVDSNDGDSQGTSLAIDKSGTVFVAWEENHGDDLWWANWTGSAWSKKQVGGIGSFISCYGEISGLGYPDYGPSAGFKPDNGKARIASACGTDLGEGTMAVRWTYYSTSKKKWVTEEPGGGLAGGATNVALAFDPDTSYPNIVVGDRRYSDVTWLHWDGSTWLQDVVQDGPGGSGVRGPLVTIAFNPVTGEPSVAWLYREDIPTSLDYATYDSATKTWTKTFGIVTDAMGVPSLTFGPDGTPWIAFQEGTDTASHLEAAQLTGSTWTMTNVDSTSTVTGVEPSAAFTGSKLRVAYYDETNGNLRWASLGSTAWSLKTLESTNDVGDFPSLAFNSSASAYISYYDLTKQDVRWARPS